MDCTSNAIQTREGALTSVCRPAKEPVQVPGARLEGSLGVGAFSVPHGVVRVEDARLALVVVEEGAAQESALGQAVDAPVRALLEVPHREQVPLVGPLQLLAGLQDERRRRTQLRTCMECHF